MDKWMDRLMFHPKTGICFIRPKVLDYFGTEKPGLIAELLITVQILCIGTDRSQQTVQTKIRLLLKKQSDQGLCCLPLHQLLLDALMQCYIKLYQF